MRPLVSIITPSFNQGRFIEETIQSVLCQDYPNVEYMVVDGGSTDDTLSILRRYEKRLRWVSEPDNGQSHAINKGFRMARGEIVAWLNSDDTYLPGAIGKVVDYLQQHPEVMMVYGEGYQIDEQSRVKQRFPPTEPFNLWRLIYYGDYILQQTVFIRKKVFDEVDILDESLHYGMDWDLWIRIGKRFKIAYIPEFLGCLREYSTAKSFSGGMNRVKELIAIMRKHGNRKYPPALLNYGWEPCQDYLIRKISEAFPGMNVGWLRASGEFLARVTRDLAFRKFTSLRQPCPAQDGWLSDRADFLLPKSHAQCSLHLSGSTQHTPGYALPLTIRAFVNGYCLGKRVVTERGDFEVVWPVHGDLPNSDLLEVSLKTNRSFVPARHGVQDHRRLTFQLKAINVSEFEDRQTPQSELPREIEEDSSKAKHCGA